jgi:hypothetical protein
LLLHLCQLAHRSCQRPHRNIRFQLRRCQLAHHRIRASLTFGELHLTLHEGSQHRFQLWFHGSLLLSVAPRWRMTRF